MYIIRGQIPSKSNCYKIVSHIDPRTKKVHSSLAKQEVLKKYEDSFYIQCPERGRMIKGYFKLKAKVYYNSNRPDLDNSLKILLDCLQMTKTIKNDRQCVCIEVEKFVDKKEPRIEYEVIPVEFG